MNGGRLAESTIRMALTYLGRRGATVNRHVAKHMSRMAGRLSSAAIHSVFRTSNVNALLVRVLQNPTRTYFQTVKGRVYLCVEKVFEHEVGRDGEKIVRVLIDTISGRIKTAHPAHALRDMTNAATHAAVRSAARNRAGAASLNSVMLGFMTAELDDVFSEVDQQTAEILNRFEREEEGADWGEFLLDMLDVTGIGFFAPTRAGDPRMDYLVPILNRIASRHASVIQEKLRDDHEIELTQTGEHKLRHDLVSAMFGYLVFGETEVALD